MTRLRQFADIDEPARVEPGCDRGRFEELDPVEAVFEGEVERSLDGQTSLLDV